MVVHHCEHAPRVGDVANDTGGTKDSTVIELHKHCVKVVLATVEQYEAVRLQCRDLTRKFRANRPTRPGYQDSPALHEFADRFGIQVHRRAVQ